MSDRLTAPPPAPVLEPDAYDQLLRHLEQSPLLAEIALERRRQDLISPSQDHPDGTGLPGQAVVAGARIACQVRTKDGAVTWRHILWRAVAEAFAEPDPARLRAKLVQVAAVAAAWAEALDRRSPG